MQPLSERDLAQISQLSSEITKRYIQLLDDYGGRDRVINTEIEANLNRFRQLVMELRGT